MENIIPFCHLPAASQTEVREKPLTGSKKKKGKSRQQPSEGSDNVGMPNLHQVMI